MGVRAGYRVRVVGVSNPGDTVANSKFQKKVHVMTSKVYLECIRNTNLIRNKLTVNLQPYD